MKIHCIVGARPNFMKIAPILAEMRRYPQFQPSLIHTGQHYDEEMSGSFFRDLGLPEPDVNLGVGSGPHGEQTANVMIAYERLVAREPPDVVLVVGDVNSTLACALVAAKLGIPVAHVEAGLRSFDRRMPEEINRILTDQLADYLFTTSRDADENLKREGIPTERVHFVGNVMIDTLLEHREQALQMSSVLEDRSVSRQGYAVLTLHRPSNVDDEQALREILAALDWVQQRLPVVFPIHPRTERRLAEYGLDRVTRRMPNLRACRPLGYLDFLSLVSQAKLVLTDSGGLQEETTVLSVPCITLRETTERPVTVTEGTNVLVGHDTAKIIREVERVLDGVKKVGRVPEKWDGHAAERIVRTLLERAGLRTLEQT